MPNTYDGVLKYLTNGTLYDFYPQTKASLVSGLATVATTNSYNDLDDKPTIPTIPDITVTVTGSGNAITGITSNGHTLTVTKGSTFLTSHQALNKINVIDIRSTTPAPSSKTAQAVTAWFNNTGTPTSIWWGGISVKGWSDGSYQVWELAGPATNSDTDVRPYYRCGRNSTWNSWHQLAYYSDIPSVPSAYTSTPSAVSSSSGSAGSSTSWARGDHTHKLTVTNKAATLSWGTTTTIATIGSQNITVKMPNYPVCLLEGTMISMADGTQKAIEDVVVGDEVVSYNPATNEKCTAVVFSNELTGEDEHDLKQAFFLDKTTNETYSIILYKDHGVYKTYSDLDPLSECHGTGINSWRCNTLKEDKALAENLHEVVFVGKDDFESPTKIRHYNLLTSNIYYFADGILCAGSQWQQIGDLLALYGKTLVEKGEDTLLNQFIALGEEIEALRPKFKSQKAENSDREGLRLKKENESAFIRRMMLLRELEDYQEQLRGYGYKLEKHQEGKITDEEFETIKAEKEAIRVKIRALESELTSGDINKRDTAEHIASVQAHKNEISVLLNNRNLFDELIKIIK